MGTNTAIEWVDNDAALRAEIEEYRALLEEAGWFVHGFPEDMDRDGAGKELASRIDAKLAEPLP